MELSTPKEPHLPYLIHANSNEGIKDDVLECVGNTPMVRLNKIPKAEGIKCEIVVKCEYFNAGGSIKDRIAKNMIAKAEEEGRLRPGQSTLIEPTSGNTGIGLAMVSAVRDYNLLIAMPQKMSHEKCDLLELLGATVYKTPSDAPSASPKSHFGVANKLHHEIADSLILDQYANPCNPEAHYETTAVEMLQQCNGRIDTVVVGAGTGGSISGISRRLKQTLPNVHLIGVDPINSVLSETKNQTNECQKSALKTHKGHFMVEGIGYDFIPGGLDRTLVDTWIRVNDKESLLMARRLIREEALLCGGSSGSAVCAAIRYAKEQNLPSSHRIVVLLPDTVRNYMSKFVSDYWMVRNDFMSPPARVLNTFTPSPSDPVISAAFEKFLYSGVKIERLSAEKCSLKSILDLFSAVGNGQQLILLYENGKFLEAGQFMKYFPELKSNSKRVDDLLLAASDLTETAVLEISFSSQTSTSCAAELICRMYFLFEKYAFLLVQIAGSCLYQIRRDQFIMFCMKLGLFEM